jgi:hypothetical protein
MGSLSKINTFSESHLLFLHNLTFYDAREYTREYWLSTSETAHLSANNTVQGAATQRRSIIIQAVIAA